MAPAGMRFQRQEAGDESGVVGDDAQVGREGQVESGAHGGAAHGRDGGRLEPAHPGERFVDPGEVGECLVLGRVLRCGGEHGPVATGAEGAALGQHDHRAHAGIGVEFVTRLPRARRPSSA